MKTVSKGLLLNNKPFVESNLVRYESDYTNSIPKSLPELKYVNTRNKKTTTSVLVSIRAARRCDDTVDK